MWFADSSLAAPVFIRNAFTLVIFLNLEEKKAIAYLIEDNVAWAMTYLIPSNISKVLWKQEIYFLKQAGKHTVEVIKNTHVGDLIPASVLSSFSTARFYSISLLYHTVFH